MFIRVAPCGWSRELRGRDIGQYRILRGRWEWVGVGWPEWIGLVAQDLFATRLRDEVGLADELRQRMAEVLPEKDTLHTVAPLKCERDVIFKDRGSIRKEGAIPEV